MTVPLHQQVAIGKYIVGQHVKAFFKGQKTARYPLVLMLEPLFRCNLACAGCGKIDYPDPILNRRLSVQECIDAVDECGAPMVAIPGGEPLLHKDMPEIVKKLIEKKIYVTLCTNALLLEKKIDQYQPSKYFNWSIHLDGLKPEHDRSVCQEGVYEKAVAAAKLAKQKGFRTNVNCTLFTSNSDPERVAAYFDEMMELGIDNITVSPGYAYERAPDQEHFLNRKGTKDLFRSIFAKGKEREKMGKKKWQFSQSDLYMDFLAGNQQYTCTPWGMPTRNVFGWQKPCYLVGEGFVKTYKELMEDTKWDDYGTGNYEKCADCMVHCGYEPTAAIDAVTNPLKAFAVALKGIKTEGDMAPEIVLDNQRKADLTVFSRHVENELTRIDAEAKAKKAAIGSRAAAAE
jgi:hopanoid biosynthesis associated radical SAM protein HpnH